MAFVCFNVICLVYDLYVLFIVCYAFLYTNILSIDLPEVVTLSFTG